MDARIYPFILLSPSRCQKEKVTISEAICDLLNSKIFFATHIDIPEFVKVIHHSHDLSETVLELTYPFKLLSPSRSQKQEVAIRTFLCDLLNSKLFFAAHTNTPEFAMIISFLSSFSFSDKDLFPLATCKSRTAILI